MSYVLFDKTAKVFAGLDGLKIVAVETQDQAVKFDALKDNPDIKVSFYNAITGASYEPVY